ncbi:GGDEF domain-containing protein [Aliidiomarina maris]|uniref:diguanylate cyclase n=2 Tax=Aliidiomarina maris TaxID=531312 RepID=A0A327WSH4_9GAMM|nr:diguanylate cyclase (GGDEF)-like protein [Aliidiomarina maris]
MATENPTQSHSMHWMAQMLQTIEVGLIVLNKAGKIELWNSFMENHSGVRVATARQRNLFELFPELPKAWLERKIRAVFELKSRAYSTWEQRPHIFKFKSVRPLTSQAPWMFQNLTLTPLIGTDGEVSHVCILVYDVTDIVTSRMSLERANHRLEELSQTDRLTDLFNRGHWEECLASEFSRLQRYTGHASLIMLDIDYFKKINDTHGHHVGDLVLQWMADILRLSLRETDLPGRYGGEEFAILLPHTELDDARQLAERLRESIAKAPFQHEDIDFFITVSLGVASFSSQFKTHTQWLEAADQALYASKHGGRNRVSTADA